MVGSGRVRNAVYCLQNAKAVTILYNMVKLASMAQLDVHQTGDEHAS